MSFVDPEENALLLPDCGIRARFLPHVVADVAQERLRFFMETGYERDSTNILTMIGPSGSGKSQIIKDLMRQKDLKPYETSDGIVRPIVYAEVPSDTSRRGILQKILNALGITQTSKTASISDLMRQAHVQLREQKCRLLVLDEAQQMTKTDSKYQYGDFVRQFVNEGAVPLLLVGLPNTLKLTEDNSQVARRSKVPLMYGALDWKVPQQLQAFDEIMASYEDTLSRANRPYPISHPDIKKAIYWISHGLVARASQYLGHALDLSHTTKSRLLSLDILKQAFQDIRLLYPELQKQAKCPFTYSVMDDELIVADFDTGTKAEKKRVRRRAKP